MANPEADTSRSTEAAWRAALSAAVALPALEDALAAILEPLAPLTGAAAAAVGRVEPAAVLARWNCEPGEVLPWLGVVARALPARTADEPELPLSPGDAQVRLRGTPRRLAVRPVGPPEAGAYLLLALPIGEQAADAPGDSLDALAAVAHLVVEREHLLEEGRRAREARDHFLMAIHHELRTPATAVMLEAGLLQSGLLGGLPPQVAGSLSRLESQVGELVRVIKRVLDLSRLEVAVEPPRDDLVDPRKLIVEVARRIEPSAARRGIALSLYFPRTLPLLQTDAGRFRRILLYLLANALKYTEHGSVHVRVERAARRVGKDKREPLLLVRVVDTGRGIPAAELERIFEPFAQVEEGARSNSQTRGVGLGLPLARKLARSLGGDVSLESSSGEGTTAVLSIPYRQPPVE